ncbi:uncharacterized protein DDB_G0286299-like [Xenia sp. Carnegie-2017]|uniref:uncharacterized protein DDB_G0286299-like n=1 Tax=Xenia sp. Carnegie-2017 TaxID=2897299 RepID=UPI001F046D98|nr:uncharacterized protein DDB_G0286299-like [Xenia sp. Carnegie-2017]
MYRSYQPITPASNKLLKQRWDDASFEEHRRKVATSKAVVDNKPPKTYMHLHLKLKKLQIEEERLATIERDNRILLEKMSQIMRTKGRVDNWNDYSVKSLNRTKRQQELLRVTHENQAILKRVLAQKPVYNHGKWEEDYLEKESYMESISKYPKEWYKISFQKKKSRKNGANKKLKLSSKDGRSSTEDDKSSCSTSINKEENVLKTPHHGKTVHKKDGDNETAHENLTKYDDEKAEIADNKKSDEENEKQNDKKSNDFITNPEQTEEKSHGNTETDEKEKKTENPLKQNEKIGNEEKALEADDELSNEI